MMAGERQCATIPSEQALKRARELEFIERWADKKLGKGNRPCGWPAFGSIAINELPEMLDAWAQEAPSEQALYASYANHCAIEKKVPMTWHTWKRDTGGAGAAHRRAGEGMSTASKGRAFEHFIRQMFEREGFSVVRGAASKGLMLEEKVDLICTKLTRSNKQKVLLYVIGVQCKCNKRF